MKDIKSKNLYIGIGTNLGKKLENINKAIKLLEDEFKLSTDKRAGIIESKAWGFESEESFLNTVILFKLESSNTNQTTENQILNESNELLSILEKCKKVEAVMGRISREKVFNDKGQRIYKSRIIDIDIILYGDTIYHSEVLEIPQHELKNREFTMIPLMEIIEKADKDFLISYFKQEV